MIIVMKPQATRENIEHILGVIYIKQAIRVLRHCSVIASLCQYYSTLKRNGLKRK